MKKQRTARLLLTVLAAAVALSGYFYWQNNGLTVTRYQHIDPDLPAGFDGFTIVQVTDLHNKSFGKNQEILLDKVEALMPDIIVISGDLIDRRRYDLEKSMTFVEGAVALAPVYFVSGNHEAWSGRYGEIREALLEAGVTVLDDSDVLLERNGETLHLLGLRDPAFGVSGYREKRDESKITGQMDTWQELEGFTILLAHRPEYFPLYAEKPIDIVFSGHAHGGQIRLPFLGALFAPNQGFLPEYSSGDYQLNETTMYLSRGLGNSIFPLRIHNRPELVMVTLSPSGHRSTTMTGGLLM